MVVGVVVVVGFGLLRAVGALLGGGSGSVDAGAVSDLSAGSGATAESSIPAVGPSGTAAVTDPTAPAETDPPGPPTAEHPAKVLIIGDSDAGTFGPYLQTLLDGTGIVTTELDYKVSSGLARPDFFDWPAEIEAEVPAVDPDIVVVTFGGNDAQGLSVASGEFVVGDPVANEGEWTAEYQKRAGDVMDQLTAGGRTLIWVGIPNDNNPDVTARMKIQDQAARAAAAERPGVVFIDTWKRFSGRDGNWAEFVIDPRDGQGKDVRADDGFHLNQNGAEILAIDVAQAIRDDLQTRGAQI